jgi:zona occludens toxin
MAISIYHGAGGSYKTSSLVQEILIPALYEGRTVISNIRGFDSVDKVAKAMGKKLPSGAKIIAVQADSMEGCEHIAKFWHWAPINSVIAMDEAQKCYPTSARNFRDLDIGRGIPFEDQDGKFFFDTEGDRIDRPTTFEIAFDQHRHFGWDIYMSTTNIAKINKEIRLATNKAFRHADVSGLLPWKKSEAKVVEHSPELSGQSASSIIGSPIKRVIKDSTFECYRSTRTGIITRTANKSFLKDPKIIAFAIFVVLSLTTAIYQGKKLLSDDFGKAAKTLETDIVQNVSSVNPSRVDADTNVNIQTNNQINRRIANPFPFNYEVVYFLGDIANRYLFVFVDGDTKYFLDSYDLIALKVKVKKYSNCLIHLSGPINSTVTCAPFSYRETFKPEERSNASEEGDKVARL